MRKEWKVKRTQLVKTKILKAILFIVPSPKAKSKQKALLPIVLVLILLL